MHYRRPGPQADFLSAYVNMYEETGTELRGENGPIYLDRTRLELHAEKRRGVKPEMMILDPNTPRGSGSDGKLEGPSLHLTNWLDCVRTRWEPNAPVSGFRGGHRRQHRSLGQPRPAQRTARQARVSKIVPRFASTAFCDGPLGFSEVASCCVWHTLGASATV